MDVLLLLTTAGSDTGPLFDLYENSTGPFVLFESAVSKVDLTTPPGYSTTVPSGTTQVRIQSTGVCENYIDIVLENTTTSTTTSTTTCPTYYELEGCDPADYAFTTIVPTLGAGQRYIDPILGPGNEVYYTYTGASITTCVVPGPYNASIQATLLTGCP
jgi:hypothetical protein